MGLSLPPALFMIVFFVVPSALLFVYSFWRSAAFRIVPDFVLNNYVSSLTSPVFLAVTGNAIWIGLLTATITTLLAVPVGYYLTYVRKSQVIFAVILLTWFSSYLVRIYAWRTLLGTNGLINVLLMQTGVVDRPIEALLFSPFAVAITLIHIYLPFAILLVVSAFSEIKRELIDASRDLGTSELAAFFKVVAPNAANALIGGFVLTFILAAGDYVTPQMLGGQSGQTTGLLIADHFRKTGNWPMGAAQAVIMFVVALVIFAVVTALARLCGILPRRAKPLNGLGDQ